MRIVLITGACVASAGLVLVSVAAKATATKPAAIVARPRVGHSPRSAVRPLFTLITGCTADDSTSLNPFGGNGNVAGGNSSAVLGSSTEACDYTDTVAGGFSNGIGGQADYSFIGAGNGNQIAKDSAFIGAGQANFADGSQSFVGGGGLNEASGNGSFVGGGGYTYLNAQSNVQTPAFGNTAIAADSFVGAGDLNQVSGPGSFIGAGGYAYASSSSSEHAGNQITGTDSFIGAGDYNVIGSAQSFIGSGESNSISSTYPFSFIGGGSGNQVLAQYGTIAGGEGGIANGKGAAIGGGDANVSGYFGTVPGGYHNDATGSFSFAAGYDADAPQAGSFVWSDTAGGPRVTAKKANQFVARASGGVIFYSNAAQTTGVSLAAGSATWAMGSDRNLKQHVVPLDDAAVLDKVASLPVSEWSYISEGSVRHVGPMAQDFYAAFGVGEDDHHIASIDADGVELAAIKALHADNQSLHVDNQSLHAENATLHAAIQSLHAENRSLHDTNDRLRERLADVNARLSAVERKIAGLDVK